MTRSLASLKNGESAEIHDIEGSFPDRSRFLELGFTAGAVIQILRRAFLGDPLVIQVRGTHYALRHADAQNIRVKKPTAETDL